MMIKGLPNIIVKKSFEYSMIQREQDIAIYSQSFEGNIIAYETIIVKQTLPHPQSKEVFERVECYPSDNQFGILGWSFANNGDLYIALQKAQLKFNQLINGHTNT